MAEGPAMSDQRRFIDDCLRDPARYGEAFRPLGPECHTVQFHQPHTAVEMQAIGALFAGRPDVTLYVYGGVKDLEFLRYFPDLRSLQLAVWDIEDVAGFRHLSEDFRALTFPRTKRRFSLRFLEAMPGLRKLFLQGHTKDFGVVSTLIQLESLGLHGARLIDLQPLLPLQGLTTLRLGFGNPIDLSLLPSFEGLQDFKLMRIAGLPEVDILAHASGLRSIDLDWLSRVSRLPDLSRLTRLEEVRLDTMKALADIAGVAKAPALNKLTVGATPGLGPEQFRPFLGHPALRELRAYVGRSRDNEAIRNMFPGIAR